MSKEKQLLTLYHKGFSQRNIATQLSVSRNTVAKVLKAENEHPIPENLLEIIEEVDVHKHIFPEEQSTPILVMPDFEYVHKELLKDGVTLTLLWEEYVSECRSNHKPPYQYSQYCKLYSDYVNTNKLIMHIQHKPGARLMVDWAGTRIPIYDRYTCEETMVYLFVATLPFSM